MAEMRKVTKAICCKCRYGCMYSESNVVCDFYLMTGKRRGCENGKCDKFEPKKRNKRSVIRLPQRK